MEKLNIDHIKSILKKHNVTIQEDQLQQCVAFLWQLTTLTLDTYLKK